MMDNANNNAEKINVGDDVILLSLPEWLTIDLPKEERDTLEDFIGKLVVVSDIDTHGYFWVGVGKTVHVDSESALYTGNSFCVPRECLKRC